MFAGLAIVIPSLMAQTPAAPKPATGSEQIISLTPVAPAPVSPDKVVMTIGDQKITAGELEQIISELNGAVR